MVDRIILAHGGGGTLMRELIEEQIGPAIGGVPSDMADSSPIPGAEDFAMTTDSFVVKPLFFRGGDKRLLWTNLSTGLLGTGM